MDVTLSLCCFSYSHRSPAARVAGEVLDRGCGADVADEDGAIGAWDGPSHRGCFKPSALIACW